MFIQSTYYFLINKINYEINQIKYRKLEILNLKMTIILIFYSMLNRIEINFLMHFELRIPILIWYSISIKEMLQFRYEKYKNRSRSIDKYDYNLIKIK